MALFGKGEKDKDLPPDGRVTRFNALLREGTTCRWCPRPLTRINEHGRGVLKCLSCDAPGGVELSDLRAPVG